tara:strand:- start:1428 stop:1616 length:189 start_codon:yes stop_codon:yes gene_type:complete
MESVMLSWNIRLAKIPGVSGWDVGDIYQYTNPSDTTIFTGTVFSYIKENMPPLNGFRVTSFA